MGLGLERQIDKGTFFTCAIITAEQNNSIWIIASIVIYSMKCHENNRLKCMLFRFGKNESRAEALFAQIHKVMPGAKQL